MYQQETFSLRPIPQGFCLSFPLKYVLRQEKIFHSLFLWMESENKTTENLEENENQENQDVDKFCKQPITKLTFLVIFWPYNKFFINQACSVKVAGYWPCSILHLYGLKRKRTWPISRHLDLMLGQ